MNRVILMGRLTADPMLRYTQGADSRAVANYTLAVDRRGQDRQADFINCVAWNKAAEFADKYFRKGQRVLVSGRLQTGSYTNKNGQKIYTTDVVVDEQEFADSRMDAVPSNPAETPKSEPKAEQSTLDDFYAVPDDLNDDGLPFN